MVLIYYLNPHAPILSPLKDWGIFPFGSRSGPLQEREPFIINLSVILKKDD